MPSPSFILFTCLLLPCQAFCQQSFTSDAIAKGTGNNSVTTINAWSVSNNQAAVACLEQPSIALSYENFYLIKQLSQRNITIAIPLKNNAIGANLTMTGYELYLHRRYLFSYGLRLSENFFAGVALSMHNLRLGDRYGSTTRAAGSMALLCRIHPKVLLGAQVVNFTGTTLHNYENERIPTVQRLGISYALSEITKLLAEFEKYSDLPANVKAGVEYSPGGHVFFRTGINTAPAKIFFGFGFKTKLFITDLAFSWQPLIGYQPSVSLSRNLTGHED